MENDRNDNTPPPIAPFWTVAIYLVELAHGGQEEGGWWYDRGERVDHEMEGVHTAHLLTVFSVPEGGGEAAADGYRTVLQKLLDGTVNVGRRAKSSVLSAGVYEAHVYNGHPPQHFPERRPHYE